MSRVEIGPQPGPQTTFLSTPADIAFYGGAAGAGKTFAELLEPCRHLHNRDFGGVIFRRTSPQIRNEGGLWDESMKLYPLIGGKPRETTLEWIFPSGARMKFAHLQYDGDVFNYQGAQIPFIAFDELTHFSEFQFFYMLTRNRSTCGVKPYIRGTCNPDPDSWVASFIEWWIDAKTGLPIPERSGVIRWFVRDSGKIIWGDSEEELVRRFHPNRVFPKSFTFIAGKIYDNPALMEADPGYLGNLKAQDVVEQARLLDGNWKVRPSAGKIINRDWFDIVDFEDMPRGGRECRFWDFAATERDLTKEEPAFTAGTKMRLVKDYLYITHCYAKQLGADDVEGEFLRLTRDDAKAALQQGVDFRVRWEIEPGSAGKRETARLIRLLIGINAGGTRPQGDKFVRIKPFAALARARGVRLVRGPWNEMWLSHMHAQPDIVFRDIMDSTSGAFNELTGPQTFHSATGGSR